MCPNCSSGIALACIGVLTTVPMLCYDKQQGAAQPIMLISRLLQTDSAL